MKTLKFCGYSDDTFACEGPNIDVDCDNCGSGRPIYMRVEGGVRGSDALIVRGQYSDGPCGGWSIGVSPANFPDNNERHIPDWPMRFERSKREYSPNLVIEAPDNVVVTLVDDNGERSPRNEEERVDLLAQARAERDAAKEELALFRRKVEAIVPTIQSALRRTA